MKSVLHVALIAPGGYSNAGLMKAFFENGFTEYTAFDFQLKMFEFEKEKMRELLIQEAQRVKPDMIFMQIQSSDILDVETFKQLSRISFTVNYTFDIRSKEQTEWLYNLAPILGLVCFSNKRDVDECVKRGYHNTIVIQSSVDMDVYRDRSSFIRDENISFIGSNYVNTSLGFPLSGQRKEMVDRLSSSFKGSFKVYGLGWDVSQIISPDQECEIYSKSIIAINQNNFNEEFYISDRIWRLMSCGAMCLTAYFKGIETLFTRYEHLDWWESIEELEYKINYYLSSKEEAKKIALQGMRHVREHHRWTDRVGGIINFVSELELHRDYIFAKIPDKDACNKAGAHVIDGVIPQPFDEQFHNRTCDCEKLRWIWAECGCENKAYQLRAQENI